MAVQTAGNPAATYAANGHNTEHPEQSEDSIVTILAAFYTIPSEYHADLFSSIREAADAHDLRRLLEAISDWAATAQVYADATLASELTEAIGSRKGVADWLSG